MAESALDALAVWGEEEPCMPALAARLDAAQSERLLRVFNVMLRRTGNRYALEAPFTMESVLTTPALHGAFLMCHAYFFS